MSRDTKIHLRDYACGARGERWGSRVISSNSDARKVTCRRCLAYVQRLAKQRAGEASDG